MKSKNFPIQPPHSPQPSFSEMVRELGVEVNIDGKRFYYLPALFYDGKDNFSVHGVKIEDLPDVVKKAVLSSMISPLTEMLQKQIDDFKVKALDDKLIIEEIFKSHIDIMNALQEFIKD